MRFTKSVSTASEASLELPDEPQLLETYPNPFYDDVRIVFESHAPVRGQLEIFDILGRRVHATPEQEYPAGKSTLTLQPDLAAGVYVFRLLLHDGNTPYRFSEPLILAK